MKNDSDFDLGLFEKKSVEAIVAGMQVVRAYQLGDKTIGEASVKKTDDTLLTVADRECGQVLQARLRQHFPRVRSNIEDIGVSPEQSRVTIYGDPIDGTGPFTVGLPTSTVILGAYDTQTKLVLACTIGEPASGRVWYMRGGKSYAATWDFTTKRLRNECIIKVWPGTLSRSTAVYLDNPHGFKRAGGRQILTDGQAGKLLARLGKYRLLMTGSNGEHQAVLAQGNDRMAGSITSSIGGPQDVCGVRLVLDAGGTARAFRMTGDRTLAEESPHDIEGYDILVAGNNQATVDELSQDLLSAVAE